MPVKIRLARIGKKGVPFYRIVAIDSRKKRDGAFLENLGTYDALKSSIVVFHADKLEKWISQGAQMTDSARKIYRLYKKTGDAMAQAQASDVQVDALPAS